jgi:hypothetical protein
MKVSVKALAKHKKYGAKDTRKKHGFCLCGCGERTKIAQTTNRRDGQVAGAPLRFIHGHNKGNLGKPHSTATRLKISEALWGNLPGNWKGENVGYTALHVWVRRHKIKTGKCATCSYEGRTEWANISGLYFRDLDDYVELCRLCHEELDRSCRL